MLYKKFALLPLLAGLLVVSTGSGCLWTRAKMNDASVVDRADRIVVGQTRESDLKGLLGVEPGMRMPSKDGSILVYTFSDAKTEGLMLIAVNFTKTNIALSSLAIDIGKDGIVKAVHRPGAQEPGWEFWPFGE